MRRGHRTGVGAAVLGLLLSATIAVADDSVLVGTDGADTITGTPNADSIYGRAGDDRISAGGGDDELDGGPGADQLSGGDGTDVVVYSGTAPVDASLDGIANDGAAGEGDSIQPDVEDLYGADGNDKLTGNGGPNSIDGAAGDDRISGGKGTDALLGGEGDDIIDARDGEIDRVDCGAGNDSATVDQNDVVEGCEQVSRPGSTAMPLTAIQGGKLYLTSVVSGSQIVIACVNKCGSTPAGGKVLTIESAKLVGKNRLVSIALPKAVRGATVEVGVTAPGATTACQRYRITARLKISRVKSVKTCTTEARGT